MSGSTPYRRSFDRQALQGTTNSPIVPLMDEVRAHLRNLSMGPIDSGSLSIAIGMPNWYRLFPIVGGLVIGAVGCVQFEETNQWMHCP